MVPDFPEHACPYARRLAAASRRFALQVYDPPAAEGGVSGGRRQKVPSAKERDPFGETDGHTGCPGLAQRFRDRVLVMAAKRCFVNCRHCTRRWLLADAVTVDTPERLRACVAYVEARPEVRDVLVSGGDPLTLSDAKLLRIVNAFAALPQVDIVRLCTRAPCANPGRITPRLAKALGRSRKVWANVQFNCADEVTQEARRAAGLLADAGIPVSCQTVLLRGVNDSVEELLTLFRALTAARIRPYYVFTCDPVAGIERFRVPPRRAMELERRCAAEIGGLALPRFVCDIPGAPRKVPVAEVCRHR